MLDSKAAERGRIVSNVRFREKAERARGMGALAKCQRLRRGGWTVAVLQQSRDRVLHGNCRHSRRLVDACDTG